MKISLGSWAFSFGPYAGDPVPFDKTVERLARAGYDGVELCGFPPHITLEAYSSKDSRRELVKFIAGHGLGVSGYSADFSWVNPLVPGHKPKYLELFRRYVELCADTGCPMIRVDSVAAPGSVDDREYAVAFDRLADTWHDAAGIAEDAGILLTWEFEPGFLFNKPSEVLELHERVAHPNFRLLFDTSHAYMCAVAGARQHGTREVVPGGVKGLLQKLEGRIGAIHLIDSDGTLHADETSTHRPFGEGRIDFDELAPRLLAVRNIDWWTVDMCFWAGSWDLVESSREFVANLLQRHGAIASRV